MEEHLTGFLVRTVGASIQLWVFTGYRIKFFRYPTLTSQGSEVAFLNDKGVESAYP